MYNKKIQKKKKEEKIIPSQVQFVELYSVESKIDVNPIRPNKRLSLSERASALYTAVGKKEERIYKRFTPFFFFYENYNNM